MSLQTSWKFSVWHLQKEEEPGGRYLKEDSVPKSVIGPALLPPRCLASSLQTLGISHQGWGPGHTPSWSPCLQSVLRLNNLPCCRSTSSSRLPTTCSPARLSACPNPDTLTPAFPPAGPSLPLLSTSVPHPRQQCAAHSRSHCSFLPLCLCLLGMLFLDSSACSKGPHFQEKHRNDSFSESPENLY